MELEVGMNLLRDRQASNHLNYAPAFHLFLSLLIRSDSVCRFPKMPESCHDRAQETGNL